MANSQPVNGTSTDIDGYYKLSGVPVGRADLNISYLGYNSASISNLIVTSGKELIVNIELEESVTTYEAVVVKANKPKANANNEMAVVSARSFTVEETEKYAGSRGDIARMASNYAGVSFANDGRNDIVIRGNSPSGLLWKLEDVEIPNPNHFAENGTTGGPVGMLNNNVLKNSDFFTGAFPAEYGNAMSGVFDLKMRNGNSEKYEFTIQSGFNGFEFGAEGPMFTNNSSFLCFYRYSTLELLDKMGVNFGTSGVPKYQDLSFKTNIPTKNGIISVFGIAGKSQISMLDSKLKKGDMYNSEGMDLYNRSSMAASGINYTHFISSRTNLKASISALYQNGGTDIDTLERKIFKIDTTFSQNVISNIDTQYYYENPTRSIIHDISESRVSSSLTLSTKFNSRVNQKIGVSLDFMAYSLNTQVYVDSLKMLYTMLKGNKDIGEGPKLFRSYYEMSYKLSDHLSFNPGVHFIYFSLSKQALIEPRVAIAWSYASNRRLNFGYGLHSRTHALSTYYEGTFMPDHSVSYTNLNLNATRSHQFVLGHDWNINDQLRLKTETYYQSLFDVPIERNRSSYSILNTGAGWGPQAIDSLVNKGTGYNYGIEVTFEKFLSQHYYFLVTTSLFDSKYKASDDTIRNTTFNGNFVVNTLLGYEYPINERYTLGFDVKMAIAGGKRYTPLNEAESFRRKESVYLDYAVNEKQYDNFYKLDVKLSLRQNGKRSSQEWQVYIENVTNHENILFESYSVSKNKMVKTYQLGFFPMVLWRINF